MSPAKIADSRRSTCSFAKYLSAAEASPYQLRITEAMSEFSHRRRQTSGIQRRCLSWVIRVDFDPSEQSPLYPDRDRTADIAGCPKRAKSGPRVRSLAGCYC